MKVPRDLSGDEIVRGLKRPLKARTVMRAHTTSTVVEDDGVVEIEGVPVRAGQRVQVIVLMPDEPAPAAPAVRYPLRGRKPFRFNEPNEPVGVEDWDE